MPVILFSMFLLLFTSILGVNHVDTAIATSKRTWLQDQVDLALYHASILPQQEALNEGIKELQFDRVTSRFYDRLKENGDLTYSAGQSALIPGTNSVVKQPVGIYLTNLSLEDSKRSWSITLKYTGANWQEVSRVDMGAGGVIFFRLQTADGKTLALPPKTVHGPALLAVAYANEDQINQYTGKTAIPIVSEQSIYN